MAEVNPTGIESRPAEGDCVEDLRRKSGERRREYRGDGSPPAFQGDSATRIPMARSARFMVPILIRWRVRAMATIFAVLVVDWFPFGGIGAFAGNGQASRFVNGRGASQAGKGGVKT
jgi:hypothetical protein